MSEIELDKSQIKITMLGSSKSGKTSWLLGMYAKMALGCHGFSLHATEADLDLEMSATWGRLVNYKGDEDWPSPTTETTEYSFDFCYGLKPLAEVQFYDSPGSALSGKSSEENTYKLIKNTKQSSCLFICISAEHLYFTSKMMSIRAIKADRMNVLIREISTALKPTTNQPFPVVFVVTKFDLYPNPDEPQQVIDAIRELFPGFWYSPGWIVSICPVSLGKNLSGDVIQGEIEPVYCEYPLLFAAYSLFHKRYLSEGKENEKEYLKLLAKELERFPTYLDGQEVSLYV